MKKTMFAIGAFCLTVAAYAAVNDALLMFSTKGPDKYADNTDVLDGECYALCYVTDSSFAIKADGTAASGGEVLLTAPVAKDGHCPSLLYVVPAEKADSLTGGSYAVYLLDTRVKAADGTVMVAGVEDGKAKVVNGAGAVAENGSVAAGTAGISTFPKDNVVQGGTVSVLSVIDNPTISAIRVDGAKIVLTVSGMSPAADYSVYAGSSLDANLFKPVEADVDGADFKVDASEGSYFKVVGERKF